MANCPKCNEPVDEGAIHCPNCGYNAAYAPPSDLENNLAPAEPGPRGTGGRTPNAELMSMARAVLSGSWGLAIGTYFLYGLVTGAIQGVPYLGGLAMLIVGGPFTLGLTTFTLRFSRQENPDLGLIFSGFNDFGRALGTYLLQLLFLIGWTLLLVVPGIIKAYAYSMTFFILADNPSIGPNEAITKSREIMDGKKWKLFCLGCRFIGWALLCILTLGIGFFWFVPYMQISLAKFYDDVATS